MADSAFCAFGEKISEKELTNIIKNGTNCSLIVIFSLLFFLLAEYINLFRILLLIKHSLSNLFSFIKIFEWYVKLIFTKNLEPINKIHYFSSKDAYLKTFLKYTLFFEELFISKIYFS